LRQNEALTLLDDNKNQDLSRQMIDVLNQDRTNLTIGSYEFTKNLIPGHSFGHDQHHLETTYHKDFINYHPEFINKKSRKAVYFKF
jgi:hypothetical protein